MAGDNHYDVLGVDPGAPAPEVRKAYVALARRYHPDFHATESDAVRRHAEEMMRDINNAWAVLGDPVARARFDKALEGRGHTFTTSTNGATTTSHDPRQAPDTASGYTPPRWMTMLPALLLVIGVLSFGVGMVTGLPAVLAAAIGFALLGGILFVIVPMIVIKRSAGPIAGERARARA